MKWFQKWGDYTAAEEWIEYSKRRWPWMPEAVRGFMYVVLGCRAD